MPHRQAVIILTSVIIALVLAEAASLAGYGGLYGEFFYVRSPPAFAPGEKPIKVVDNVFHPFFGYVHRYYKPKKKVWREGDPVNPGPEPGYWVNNHGFGIVSNLGGGRQNYDLFRRENENCCDLPLGPQADQILVGVFGGSVARDFAMHARRYGSLADALKDVALLAGKKITVLNFAMGGYRQPQQLMILNYFQMLGQRLDIVINVDGFNEVYHGMLNHERGVDITFPPEDIWGQLQQHIERLNMRVTDQTGIEAVYHDLMARRSTEAAEQCTLTICFVVEKLRARYHRYRSAALTAREGGAWEKVSHFFRKVPPPAVPEPRSDEQDRNDPDFPYSAIATYWASASRMMADLATANGFLYVHVLQPNAHFSTARAHSIPARNAWTPRFAEPVVRGYPALVAKMKELRNSGVVAVDATTVFDDADGEFYRDSCCHYNDEGTDILVRRVAREIEAHLAPVHVRAKGDK